MSAPLPSNSASPSAPQGLAHDPAWPRTGSWPAAPAGVPGIEGKLAGEQTAGGALTPDTGNQVDLALIGIPTHETSLSPTGADATPAAVREALKRYSSHLVLPDAADAGLVLDTALRIVDAGDVADPDSVEGEQRATERVAQLARQARLVVALGGDNALTVPAALGVAGSDLATAGLITIDAHHDLRDGRSNGSPVRRLVEAGLAPERIVQIGIADFANSLAYRQRARDMGITVIHRDELHDRPLDEVAALALGVAGSAGGPIHVDLDVDVCDRSVAPGCPASIPGGIQAHELRRLTRLFARDPRVRGFDIAEVDATADSPDGRTVRLAALLVLEAAAGLALRDEGSAH